MVFLSSEIVIFERPNDRLPFDLVIIAVLYNHQLIILIGQGYGIC